MFARGGQQLPCHLCQQSRSSREPTKQRSRQLLRGTLGLAYTRQKEPGEGVENHWRGRSWVGTAPPPVNMMLGVGAGRRVRRPCRRRTPTRRSPSPCSRERDGQGSTLVWMNSKTLWRWGDKLTVMRNSNQSHCRELYKQKEKMCQNLKKPTYW